MEEARRFLRYVVPGLILIIEVSLYLGISAYEDFISIFKENVIDKDISVPLSVFLASGGIGFLLGIIYRDLLILLNWISGIKFSFFIRHLIVDHVSLIKDAVDGSHNWIELKERGDCKKVDISMLKQDGAWRIVTSFWHERKETSDSIKSANARIDSMTDIMHGLGTSFIGSIVASILWVIIYYKLFGFWPYYCYFYILPIVLPILHFINYQKVVKDCQSVIHIIMSDVLQKEFSDNKTSTKIFLGQDDIKKKKADVIVN